MLRGQFDASDLHYLEGSPSLAFVIHVLRLFIFGLFCVSPVVVSITLWVALPSLTVCILRVTAGPEKGS